LKQGVTITHLCSFLARTQAVREIGGCRSYFVTSSDVDLQLRLGHVGRVWFEPVNSYLYRLHDDSITHRKQSSLREFYDATAREFSRQRALTGSDDLDRGCPPTPPEVNGSRPMSSRDQIQEILRGRAWREHREGHKLRAIMTGVQAVVKRPTKPSIWKCLAALVIKRPGTNGREGVRACE
jgi:hypothetical protein